MKTNAESVEKKSVAIRELYLAIKTRKYTKMTIFHYWIWRMNRLLNLPY